MKYLIIINILFILFWILILRLEVKYIRSQERVKELENSITIESEENNEC